MTTQEIEAIIRVSALEPVEEALKNAGVSGLTISRGGATALTGITSATTGRIATHAWRYSPQGQERSRI